MACDPRAGINAADDSLMRRTFWEALIDSVAVNPFGPVAFRRGSRPEAVAVADTVSMGVR